MTAATTTAGTPVGRVRIVALGLAVAAILAGAALMMTRGPGPSPAFAADAFVSVTLPDGGRIYVQEHEVTVADWALCHRAGACALALRAPPGFDPATTPATGISHADAADYVAWVNDATGGGYRLPSWAEWTHLARDVAPDIPAPLFDDPALAWAADYIAGETGPRALQPTGAFSRSPDGIADLDGSVWEWTQDCFAGAAGSADPDRCPAYVVGGEHIAVVPYLVRDPARGGCAVGSPPAHLGLRLVSDRPA